MPRASTPTLRILPVPAETLRRLRAQGHDDYGHPWVPQVRDEGGRPLRCCLRDSVPEESIALIAYAPVRADFAQTTGPYAEVGPIFVHAEECDGYTGDGSYPRQWSGRRQVLRAYHFDGSIAGGAFLEPGDDRDAAARELLADPDVAFIHSRNVVFGCYMLEIQRA